MMQKYTLYDKVQNIKFFESLHRDKITGRKLCYDRASYRRASFSSHILFACVYGKNGQFSLPKSLVPKQIIMPAFEQEKFSRVYGRQRRLDKYTVMAKKRRPSCEIKV
jgi:hypothetical protein